jgi:hypothetical protein
MLDATDLLLGEARVCDLILGGHDHHFLWEPHLHVIKTGTDLQDLSIVHVHVDSSSARPTGVPMHCNADAQDHQCSLVLERVHTPDLLNSDAAFRQLVHQNLGAIDDTFLCEFPHDLSRHLVHSRQANTYMGQLVARLLHQASRAQFGVIVSGGALRRPIAPALVCVC